MSNLLEKVKRMWNLLRNAGQAPHELPTAPPGEVPDARVPTRTRRTRDNDLAQRRLELVNQFQQRMMEQFGLAAIREQYGKDYIPDVAIYSAAGEISCEYYRWRSGQLPDGCPTQKNIESVLTWESLPPKPRKRSHS